MMAKVVGLGGSLKPGQIYEYPERIARQLISDGVVAPYVDPLKAKALSPSVAPAPSAPMFDQDEEDDDL